MVNYTYIHSIGVRVGEINSAVRPSYISAKYITKEMKDNKVYLEGSISIEPRNYF
jgi:hypothetical protein